MENTEPKQHYEIFSCNLDKLQRQVKKLNRVAARLRSRPTTIEEGQKFYVRRNLSDSDLKMIEKIHVYVDVGEPPSLNGWQFQATLINGAWLGDANGVVVKCAPGVVVDRKWYSADPCHCGHCNKKRGRKDTFLVKNTETGDFQQVGRQCLKDFLGHNNPQDFVNAAECLLMLQLMGEDEDEWGDSGRGLDLLDRKGFLEMVCAMVRLSGYVSSKSSDTEGGSPTAGDAWWMLVNPPQKEEDRVSCTKEDMALAATIEEWVPGWLEGADNDYTLNVKAAWETEIVSIRTKGIIASVIAAYKRETEKQIRREYQKKNPSEHLGTVGDRHSFGKVVLASEFNWETDWGTTHLYKFLSGSDVIVWKSSVDKELELGIEYTLKGTIKEHGTYKNEKQTVVSRCSVEGI